MNTTAIRDLTTKLDAARAQLNKEKEILRTMELENGQDCSASVTFCGKRFELAYMTSYYMPAAVKQLDTVRLALIEYQKACVNQRLSTVEGLEWKVRQATKGGAA
jgi:hypothetical protein